MGCASSSSGLQEALDGAPRLELVAAGSADAMRFDNAATLRSGGTAPLTANGKNVGLYWPQPRNAWGHWDYIDLGVSEKLRPLRVKLDAPFIIWNGPHGEFAFDVAMWQLHEGQHLVALKACAGDPGGPTRMSKDAAGRDFVLHADGTIGPRTATHLRLGVVSTIGNLRPGWSAHEDIDMAYQGDVEIIHNWREEHSIEDLQRIVERKGYSAISVGSFDHAALKKFPYQLTAGHCEPSPGYSNTFYIWHGRGGGGKDWDGFEDDESGALGIISSVQPTKTETRQGQWTWPHMAGPFKEGLLSYAFLAIGFSLLLGPGVSLKARVGLCWVAIPGLMAVAGGSGVVAFIWMLVGIIVYRCKKWCADVVARIEAIESTMEVRQNPPPPRHDFLNMYSGEIGICVLLFYLVFLYQHSL